MVLAVALLLPSLVILARLCDATALKCAARRSLLHKTRSRLTGRLYYRWVLSAILSPGGEEDDGEKTREIAGRQAMKVSMDGWHDSFTTEEPVHGA